MYLSSSDGVDGVDVGDNSQTRHGNTPPVNSNPSQSSSPSCPTLLVIDDNSNSNDSSLNTTDIPSNSVSATAQTAHIQVPPSSPLPTLDPANDTPEKQRRRNSSIAKLLGGQPLNNQQYEEINQQILDDQSAQNGTNSDNKTDNSIPRARSSLTRTLFMNAERNNNNNTPPTMNKARPPSPEYSKDFEYLIRRELDIDHAPSTLTRKTSTPSVFQNLSSVRNTPPINNAQSPSQSKLKRKRPNPKQTIPTSTPTPTTNKPSNIAPFTIRDPFELDSSVPPINPVNIHSSQRQQNDLFRFDGSSHRLHRHHHHQHHQHPHHPNQQQQQQQQQPQQQYSLPMNNSTGNSTSFNVHKLNLTSPSYAQFKIHHDRLPSASSCSSSSSSPYNYCPYPPTTELALPTPVSIHASSPSMIPYHTGGASSRKNKTMHSRPDIYEIPMQRSCSTMSNQSNASTTSPSSSGHHSVPLKKRLLHAYKNEQRPSSSL